MTHADFDIPKPRAGLMGEVANVTCGYMFCQNFRDERYDIFNFEQFKIKRHALHIAGKT
jgi:hypothetical protein